MPQSLTCFHCHIIFSTRNRQCLIADNLGQRLYAYMGGVVENENGKLIAAGGIADHVHLLVQMHARSSVGELVRAIRANSSKWVHQTFPTHSALAWQTGYGAFAVSESNVDRVRQYIEQQPKHHQSRSFKEEFIEFLTRHGVAFDERYQ